MTRETAGESLWWYFALALLVVSLAESVLSGRYLAAGGGQTGEQEGSSMNSLDRIYSYLGRSRAEVPSQRA